MIESLNYFQSTFNIEESLKIVYTRNKTHLAPRTKKAMNEAVIFLNNALNN